MSEAAQPSRLSATIAEEVLRAIFGEDLKGCTVTFDSIAAVVDAMLKRDPSANRDLMDVYSKVVEAIHLLATPPANAQTLDPDALRSLLGQRLDSIHTLTKRTMETTALVKSAQDDLAEGG